MQRNALQLSLAEKTGIIALLLALLICLFNPVLAAIPLSLFLLCCLVAPFLPGFGFFLPMISRGHPVNRQVALTFDDGPSPSSTPVLLDLLARHQLLATFFVVGEKAAAHPELIALILAQGHSVGNHSLRHDSFLMLRRSKTLQTDIHATQEILHAYDIIPLVFRPPVGITNPRLQRVLARENLIAISYSCRAFDRGNRNIRNLAGKIMRRLRPGDIIMLHDLPPHQPKLTGCWLNELERLFTALQCNFQVVTLDEIIRHPVMKHAAAGSGG